MKHFKLTSLVVALAGVFAVLPVVQAEVPRPGDLDIYSSGKDANKNPTIMLVMEASTLTNISDAYDETAGDLEIIGIAKLSKTSPPYKRMYYYNSYSNTGAGGTNQAARFPTRLTRIKDAIFYLMDTPGVMPDDYRIGLTRYSGGVTVADNPRDIGDGFTGNVVIAANRLGPIVDEKDLIKVPDDNGTMIKVKGDTGKFAVYTNVASSDPEFVQTTDTDMSGKYVRIMPDRFWKSNITGNYNKILGGRYAKLRGIYYTKQRVWRNEERVEEYVINDNGEFKLNPTVDPKDLDVSIDSGQFLPVDDKDFIDISPYETYIETCDYYSTDSDGNPVTNEDGKLKVSTSHRCLIKTYAALTCESDPLCTGNAPMASAYAEAGAYMMGTKTAALTKNTATDNSDVYPQRALRLKDKIWEYCPQQSRLLQEYKKGTEVKRRFECIEDDWLQLNVADSEKDKPIYDGAVEVEGVKFVTPIAPYTWVGNADPNKDDEPESEDIAAIEAKGQDKYDLLWFPKTWYSEAQPYGVKGQGVAGTKKGWSPFLVDYKEYTFEEDDSFDRHRPTPEKPNGVSASADGYTYFYDVESMSESRLKPVLRQRQLRRNYVGFNNYRLIKPSDLDGKGFDYDYTGLTRYKKTYENGKPVFSKLSASDPQTDYKYIRTPPVLWEYCNTEEKRDGRYKGKLVNYIYSSYRIMCTDEQDWIEVSRSYKQRSYKDRVRYNTDKSNDDAKQLGLRWNSGLFVFPVSRGGRPHGVHGRYKDDGKEWYFFPDPILAPYDGWQYFYNMDYPEVDQPALPPTLNTGYSTSGIRNAPPDVRADRSYEYKRPTYSECSGIVQTDSTGTPQQGPQTVENAILFLTAARPYSTIARPTAEMNMSLTPKSNTSNTEVAAVGGNMTKSTCNASGLSDRGASAASYWSCMGEYSRRLRQAEDYKNPAGVPIKTGVFMFTGNRDIMESTGVNSGIKTYNCDSARTVNQKNACKLGQYGEGYGEGGFFQSTVNDKDPQKGGEQLAQAVVKIAENLVELGLVPTSTPAVPKDDYNVGAVLNYGYLPLMEPNSDGSAQWRGNLRKYIQKSGTYVDKQTPPQSPFASTDAALLSKTSWDYWADGSYSSNKMAGGVYDNIKMPQTGLSIEARKIYISHNGSLNDDEPVELNKVTATLDGVNTATSDIDGLTAAEKTTLNRLLFNYMGFGISADDYATATDTIILESYKEATPSLGGVFHSTPIALTSRLKKVDENTNKYEALNDYILFGAMDNALHLVDNTTGEEVFSYFPKEVLTNNGQYKAITNELTVDKNEISPSFGVDGPWTSYASYGQPTDGIVEADQLYVYGGARLGAKAYYGLELTGIHNNKAPKQLFTITPQTKYKTESIFSRLGYTWGKPVITKIRWEGEPKLVAVLTGGYDTYFDKSDSVRRVEYAASNDANDPGKAAIANGTTGNAIYIVDAETGKPLIIASSDMRDSGNTKLSSSDTDNISNTVAGTQSTDLVKVNHKNLKYSIAGKVKVLDRDADELADNLYFADLNGQVFRMDIDNLNGESDVKDAVNKKVSPSVRVVRLANLIDTSVDASKESAAPIGARFYEVPVVTIHEEEGERFAVVSLASGDRSNPLWPYSPPTYEILGDDGKQLRIMADPGSTVTLEVRRYRNEEAALLLEDKVEIGKSGETVINIGVLPTQDNEPIGLDASDYIRVDIKEGDESPYVKDDHVFAIYDKDVVKSDFYSATKLLTRGITFDQLVNVDDESTRETSSLKEAGWKSKLDVFSVYQDDPSTPNIDESTQLTTKTELKAVKSLGSLSALSSQLYVPIYNPRDGRSDELGCTAEVVGSSEALRYCLPYGNGDCQEGNVVRFKTGNGIQSIAFGGYGDNNQGRDLLTAFALDPNNPIKDKVNLNNSNPIPQLIDTTYSLNAYFKPLMWYDLQSQKLGTTSTAGPITSN